MRSTKSKAARRGEQFRTGRRRSARFGKRFPIPLKPSLRLKPKLNRSLKLKSSPSPKSKPSSSLKPRPSPSLKSKPSLSLKNLIPKQRANEHRTRRGDRKSTRLNSSHLGISY